MNIESGIVFFNRHKANLFVPFVGIGLSTFTPYSIFTQRPLALAFLVAIASCLAAALLIYTLVLLAAMIDDMSERVLNIHVSWIFGVACFSLFVARGAALYLLLYKQGDVQIADIEGAARLLAFLLIGVMLIQVQNSKAERNKRKSEIHLNGGKRSKKEESISG